jgi:hypothetical protein
VDGSAYLSGKRRQRVWPRATLAACLLVWIAGGCEKDEFYDHEPPAGQGSLVVANESYGDLDLFVDGQEIGQVKDGSERILDFAPGVCRVVLRERHGDRGFGDDVDILEGQLSILHVRDDSVRWDRYSVWVEYE